MNQLPQGVDLNIFYSGGSGGFLLLHLLLLSGKYWCHLNSDDMQWHTNTLRAIVELYQQSVDVRDYINSNVKIPESDYNNVMQPDWLTYPEYLLESNKVLFFRYPDLESYTLNSISHYNVLRDLEHNFYYRYVDNLMSTIIDHQWDPNRITWKTGEVWPSNVDTLAMPAPKNTNKIYFTCNDVNSWVDSPGEKVIIWTDMHSLIRLCWEKKANIFANTSSQRLIESKLQIKRLLDSAKLYNQDKVFDSTAECLQYNPITIKLQDLCLSTNLKPLQLKLLNTWKSQHSKKLLLKSRLGS